jgi:HK97 family phage portal protein
MIVLQPSNDGELKLDRIATKDFGNSDAFSDNAGWTSLFSPYGMSHTGLEVTPISALQSGTVMACVRILCGDIAKLPLKLMRRGDDGIWLEDRKNPLSRLIRKPNKRMTECDMVTSWVFSLLLTGNAYTAVLRDTAGRPQELVPLLPTLVSITEDNNGDLFYYAMSRLLNPFSHRWTEEDMIHVRSMSLDNGIRGASPIQLCSEVVGLSLATQQLAASLFKNNGFFSGYLSTPNTVNKEALETIRDAWSRNATGMHNAYKTPVLGYGFDFKQTQMTAEQAQLESARKLIVEECARIFGVPLYKLGSNEKSSYNSIDAVSLDYIDGTLRPLINPIQQALNRTLLFDREFDDYRFEFDLKELERGDLKTQSDYNHQLLSDGVLSVDEVRKSMNLPPIPDGSGAIRTRPLNTGVVGDTTGLPVFQIQAPIKETETEQVPSQQP